MPASGSVPGAAHALAAPRTCNVSAATCGGASAAAVDGSGAAGPAARVSAATRRASPAARVPACTCTVTWKRSAELPGSSPPASALSATSASASARRCAIVDSPSSALAGTCSMAASTARSSTAPTSAGNRPRSTTMPSSSTCMLSARLANRACSAPGCSSRSASPPRPHQPLHVRGRGAQGHRQQPRLGGRRGHPGQGAHLRIGRLAARHGRGYMVEVGQRGGDAQLLARGAEIEAGAPVQPVCAGAPPLPAVAGVELAQLAQQLVSSRIGEEVRLVAVARARACRWPAVAGADDDAPHCRRRALAVLGRLQAQTCCVCRTIPRRAQLPLKSRRQLKRFQGYGGRSLPRPGDRAAHRSAPAVPGRRSCRCPPGRQDRWVRDGAQSLAATPPSILMVSPLMKRDCSDARNSARLATSSG